MTTDTLPPVTRIFRRRSGRLVGAYGCFVAIVSGYAAVNLITAEALGGADPMSPLLVLAELGAVAAAVFLAVVLLYALGALALHRPFRPGWFLPSLRWPSATTQRLLGALSIMPPLLLFTAAFGSFRAMIPALAPYRWDAAFAAWDQALHGGRQPWEWLQPLLGQAWLTGAIRAGCSLWLALLLAVVLWQAFSLSAPRRRMQFFLSLVLVCSLLGTAAAVLLPSAGPGLYGRVTGLPDPFAPLIGYLRSANESAPAWALQAQSLPVAMATLSALAGWRASRLLGAALALYAALVLVGSVHLGWRYAVDGYAAVAGTWLIWRTVGWLLRRAGG